jgi:dolichol kinase
LLTNVWHYLLLPQRTGRREELLGGPVLYGLVHTGLVTVAWRTHPAAVLALTAVCWGDGLADVVGRAARSPHPLPWNRAKVGRSLGCCAKAVTTGHTNAV